MAEPTGTESTWAAPAGDAASGDVAGIAAAAARIRENVGRVIVGKDAVVEHAIVALLSEGHILLDDVPGLGKTMLAKSLARSLGLGFRPPSSSRPT